MSAVNKERESRVKYLMNRYCAYLLAQSKEDLDKVIEGNVFLIKDLDERDK